MSGLFVRHETQEFIVACEPETRRKMGKTHLLHLNASWTRLIITTRDENESLSEACLHRRTTSTMSFVPPAFAKSSQDMPLERPFRR